MDAKRAMLTMSLALALVAATASYAAGESCAAQHQHSAPGGSVGPVVALPQHASQPRPVAQPQPVTQNLPTIAMRRLLATEDAVARAIGHVQAGRQQDALGELRLIRASLESLRQAIERNAAASFVNDRCPIMGTAIDPARVPATLIRMHEGRKVAFCCGGCPQAWDQLAHPERTTKLASATARPQ